MMDSQPVKTEGELVTKNKRIAKKIAHRLFTEEGTRCKAMRLVMEFPGPSPGEHMIPGTGWCQAAVENLILEILNKEQGS
jgi:hypothetical protein